MKLLLILCFFIQSASALVIEKNYQTKSFAEAKAADNYIHFEGESTKLGLVTTSFEGYAKEFMVTSDDQGQIILNTKVVIKAGSFDTDLQARDDKLREEILDIKNNPEVTLLFPGAIKLDLNSNTYNAKLSIGGKESTLPVKLSVVRDGKYLSATGEAVLSIKESQIPDPSILIAKVKDQIKLKFKVQLP